MATHPLVVHVTDLLRRPGARREVQREVPLAGLVLTSSEVPEDRPVGVDLLLEAQGEQLIVEGTVWAVWTGACRRCLEPTSGRVEARVEEVFERHPTEGETWPLTGEHVDLEPLVREAVLLALPLAPLCGPDCLGPDPERFPATVEGVATGDEGDEPAEPPLDPRWAALEALKFDE